MKFDQVILPMSFKTKNYDLATVVHKKDGIYYGVIYNRADLHLARWSDAGTYLDLPISDQDYHSNNLAYPFRRQRPPVALPLGVPT